MTIEVLGETFKIHGQLERIKLLQVSDNNIQAVEKKGLIKRFITEYWGSKEFFSTFLPLMVAALTALWALFKG